MTSFQAPRGTTDILSDDQRDRLAVQRVCADLAETFGYEPILTPTFEDSDLFLRTTGESTDIVQKETYTFEDRGGHSLTLRPEGTPGVCRAYLERGLHNTPQPARLYYIMPMYRFERPQAGRFREFWQFGVEALGDSDPAIDAEVIELAWRVLESFGMTDVTLLVNSIGDAESRPAYLDALRDYFAPHADSLSPDDQRRLRENTLRVLDSKDDEVQPLLPDAPKSIDYLSDESKAHWDTVLQSLDALGIRYEIDHTLVRGLDYYTRTVFEFVPPDARRQSTILGRWTVRRPHRGAGRPADSRYRIRHGNRARRRRGQETGDVVPIGKADDGSRRAYRRRGKGIRASACVRVASRRYCRRAWTASWSAEPATVRNLDRRHPRRHHRRQRDRERNRCPARPYAGRTVRGGKGSTRGVSGLILGLRAWGIRASG